MLHYVLANVYILINTHKVSMKYITELSSVYVKFIKSDQICIFNHIIVLSLIYHFFQILYFLVLSNQMMFESA